jgi:hypothetical protein
MPLNYSKWDQLEVRSSFELSARGSDPGLSALDPSRLSGGPVDQRQLLTMLPVALAALG